MTVTLPFVTPEGVELQLTRAPINARLGALLLDILVTMVPAIAALILLAAMDFSGDVIGAAFGLMFLFARFFYFVLAELAWNGVSLGKKRSGLRVVRANGAGLDARAIVARNLTREAEVFLPLQLTFGLGAFQGGGAWLAMAWIALCLSVPVFNKRNQRLGDIMADTMVIVTPKAQLLADLARQTPQTDSFRFLPHQLDHYGAYELQTLEKLLRAKPITDIARRNHKASMTQVAEQIATKIGWGEALAPEDAPGFLDAFYRAQRAYLEERQLWGDRRDDKHVAAQRRQ